MDADDRSDVDDPSYDLLMPTELIIYSDFV